MVWRGEIEGYASILENEDEGEREREESLICVQKDEQKVTSELVLTVWRVWEIEPVSYL